ncbi:hypothetical protein BN85413520 [Alteracholeplasma palmae J233]|uniref:PEP-utilising enzyme C-terminal domain-containing protein n=1 Tax=Alteracholeplasma palmae (strain ATCC 49389 / J233) TaxID=1318466 RepID=U4KLS4_ALTPJ|nr:putative PEP-binding protein [Alteracholeplasma palmae]CCV64929.1 hypothetical protein BN85413520 [Alteracholeplasma palmae J233]
MTDKHGNYVVISIDVEELIDKDKTAIKEKKKWIKLVIKREIERLFWLTRLGYYQKNNCINDITVLQEAYNRLMKALDEKEFFKTTNLKEQLFKKWDLIIHEVIKETCVEKTQYNILSGLEIINTSFKRFIYQIERVFMIMQLPYDKIIKLTLKNATPQHIINLPQNIEEINLVDPKEPKELYEFDSNAKYPEEQLVFTDNDQLRKEVLYYARKIRKGKIGVELSSIKEIEKIENKDLVDAILIRTENMYLRQNLVVTKKDRIEEYNKIIDAFPGRELIIIFPDQQLIYQYLGIEEDARLHPHILSRHYSMYELELYCINEISKNCNVKVVFPSITNDQDYIFYRHLIESSLKLYPYEQLLEVGIMIDNEVVYEYLKHYKPFDFLILDTKKLYNELYEEKDYINLSEFKNDFMNEVREIHQHSRLRNKPDYIMGKLLKNKEILLKTFKMGYKNFIITVDCLNEYNQLINSDKI